MGAPSSADDKFFDVFISYSSKDKHAADAACAIFEQQGLRCWIAPRNICGGMEYAAAIMEGIRGSRLFLLILSKNSNLSPQVRCEVERAVSHGLPVISVRLESVPLEPSLELFLSKSHWRDALTPPVENHLREAAADAQLLLSGVRSGPAQPPAVPAGGRPRRGGILAGAVAAVIAAGGIAYYVAGRGGGGEEAVRTRPAGMTVAQATRGLDGSQGTSQPETRAESVATRAVTSAQGAAGVIAARAACERGVELLARGDAAGALIELDESIRLHPTAEACAARGKLHASRKNDALALADLSRAVSLDARYAPALAARGEFHRTRSRLDEALADLDAAITLDPASAEARVSRAATYCQKRDFTRALADAEAVVASDAKSAAALFWRGTAQLHQQKYAEAIADFGKALALDPSHAAAYCNRGAAQQRLGRHDAARKDYDAALAADPRLVIALNARGMLCLERRDFRQAVIDFTEMLSIEEHAVVYSNRGYALAHLGEFPRALADFEKAIALEPTRAATYCNRGVAYMLKKDQEKALADFTTAIRYQADDASAWRSRATIYLARKEFDLALADLNRSLRLKPADAEALLYRGFACVHLNRPQDAIASLDEAIRLQPDLAKAYLCRGMAHKAAGHTREAIADLEHALKLDPRVND